MLYLFQVEEIRRAKMINYDNKGQIVHNKKTGTAAMVLCQWKQADGSEIVEVDTGRGKRYWKLESVAF